ncbi:pentapeptide repeat-containing protein [Winogradskyella sp. UBA3174]|tara:strand:- start:4222 stop:4407 length:186 start_codon:yes stop_codon:yes gene_type:complete
MQNIDFTDVEIKGASFSNYDLTDSLFDNTNLEKTDFYTAYNFSINPSQNQIKGTVFSKENC